MENNTEFTYSQETYKIVSVDLVKSVPLKVAYTHKIRKIKPPFLFRWFMRSIELPAGYYYLQHFEEQYHPNEDRDYIDPVTLRIYRKPYIIVKFHKREGNGGFEKKIYRNTDEEIEKLFSDYSNKIKFPINIEVK